MNRLAFFYPLVLAGRAGGGGADLAAPAAEAGNEPGGVYRRCGFWTTSPSRAAARCGCGTWLLLLRRAGAAGAGGRVCLALSARRERAPIKESRVYILDNTLSHQANDGFTRDRDRVAAARSASGPSDVQMAVIELTSVPRVVVAFGESREAATQKLQGPGAVLPARLLPGGVPAGQLLLGNSLGEQQHIILLGDNQENQWTEAGHVLPFLKDVEITLPEVTTTSRPNVALTNPSVRRMFVDDRAVAECAVRLYHLGEQKTASLVFRANGKEVARREVSLAGSARIDQRLSPMGDRPRPMALRRGPAGRKAGYACRARTAWSSRSRRSARAGWLLLAQSPFLRVALSPEIMKGRWKTRVLDASELRGDGQTQPEEDVLCVESHFLHSAPARRLVLNYLDGGRGVLLLVDQTTPLVSAFLRELGIESVSEAPQTPAAHFRYVFMEHPIFQPFRSPDFGNLMEIQVQRHRRLAVPIATPLAYSSDGDPLFLEFPRPRGKLFVLSFSLDRTETNWPIHPTFIPFLGSLPGPGPAPAERADGL